MKFSFHHLLVLSLLFFSCRETERKTPLSEEEKTKSITVDSAFRDMVKKNIQFISDRHFSEFKTHLEAQFFTNGALTDSINENNYEMMSWYNITNDTIDLVAHINDFESEALLLRFVGGKTSVKFYRAPHETVGNYFKINKNYPLLHQFEVTPMQYKLELSGIPDTMLKQIVYGHIEMQSGDYYDSRDSVEKRHRVKMKFYFRSSQYRKIE